MKGLMEYIIALTNLYGIVHKDLVVEIYNSQNGKKVSKADLNLIIDNSLEELEDEFVYIYKDYFVHETIIVFDEFEIMLQKKEGKPHYIPNKNELLKYVDGMYIEKNKEYWTLVNYISKDFFNGDIEKSEEFCEDIYGMCQFAFNVQAIFNHFEYRDINFKDIDHANEVMQLVMNLANNVRIWENNGFTPDELFNEFERDSLKNSPEKPFVVKKEKIGRNDPCPCGSGKKYKKCCLGKDE